MKRSEAREQAFALTFERTINRESVSRIIDAAGLSKDMIVDDFAERLAEGAEQHEAEIDAQIEKNIRGWKMNRLSKVSLSLIARWRFTRFCLKTRSRSAFRSTRRSTSQRNMGQRRTLHLSTGSLGSVAKEFGEKHA